jgi:hypothetical protein
MESEFTKYNAYTTLSAFGLIALVILSLYSYAKKYISDRIIALTQFVNDPANPEN